MERFTLAPIRRVNARLNVAENTDLGHCVQLAPVPEWLRSEHMVENLGLPHRELLEREAALVLAVPYDAATFGELVADGTDQRRSREQANVEAIQLTNLALWLAQPSRLQFDCIIHVELTDDGTWFRRSYAQVDPICHHVSYANQRLSAEDLVCARQLNEAIQNVDRRSAIWRALWVLWKALTEPVWDVRYLLLWIGLEALFGPDDGREISFRLAQRMALFLQTPELPGRGLFDTVKKGYSWRSKIVHGASLLKLGKDDSIRLLADTESLLRRGLLRVLLDTEVRNHFSGREREAYLDALAFQDA